MKKFLSAVALLLAVVSLNGSSAPEIEFTTPAPTIQKRASIITPEMLSEIDEPVSESVRTAAPIGIDSVQSIDDVRAWIYQNCPVVKVTTTPGEASFYLPENSAIAIGSDTEGKYLPFVIAHEISHHYQWMDLEGDRNVWNAGMSSNEGLPPKLEVQADHITFEVVGFQPDIANYAKVPANPTEKAEALRILDFGKTAAC